MFSQVAWLPFLLPACADGQAAQILDDGSFSARDEVAVVELQGARRAPLQLLGEAFDGVVKAERGAEEWVVFFCVNWLDQCKDLRDDFRRLGTTLEDKFNKDRVFSAKVRFAEVDCAEDKVLCNKQNVDNYPTIVRYNHGARTSVWEGRLGAPRNARHQVMHNWLYSEVGTDVPRPVPAVPESESPFRWAATCGSFMALVVVLVKMSADILMSTVEAVRISSGAPTAEEAVQQRAKEAAAATRAANSPFSRLARRLPQDWAAQRPSIDL
eukprot:gb/GFBE01020196.1/.p1 GENE.gb/GFBE01020196.1/~~gb/GFBE01020196.1/.p1  ORF type:complete len:269 (+),score=54.42 gb/GFBE01020196.1/:1-807(+)